MDRRLRLLLATAVVAALVASVAAQAGDGLVRRASHEAGFTVPVPATWRYRDATYPSDHSTELWTDPRDRNAKLEVEVSGCAGCVEPTSCVLKGTGCRPAPENILPARLISKRKLDRWRIRWVQRPTGSPYPIRGLVAIVHRGEEILGFALARVWLPPAKASVADAMLAGFRLGSPG